ncbi:MAG: sigma-70 family RNA polymerase sigma factor [Planctomycetes bacterium]|nr:sigma-70 family RNA polymerase sigma factor [Planctomycetota bacterium]
MDERTERRAEAAYAEYRRTRGPRAMAEVFDLTAGELLLLARRLARNAATAEDLVQQTFVRAIERAEQFDPERRLLPWLTTILANEARMLRRRGEPDPARIRQREVAEPPEEAARHEMARAMDAAFAELPTTYADVVAMRLLHDMKPRRIAAALAIPVATVKTRLRRGVQQLAANLPPGLAFATAVSLLAGRGMAAVRGAVLTRALASAPAVSLAVLLGSITMKKFAVLLAAALVLLASLPLWWDHEPAGVGGTEVGTADAASTARGDLTLAVQPQIPLERTTAPEIEKPTVAAAGEAVVAIDVLVRAIWKTSRQPAPRVPLALVVQSNDHLAQQWTDPSGQARFAIQVPGWHWQAGVRDYPVSVTTPLMPGRFFNLEVTNEPGTLEVELDDGQRVAGKVVDAAGEAVAGADVRLALPYYADAVVARSDAAGEFVLAGLPAGFALRASAGTMESAVATITDLENVGADARAGRLVLKLVFGGDLLRVRVVSNDEPVAEATVRLDTGWRSKPPRAFVGTTDAEGVTTFAGVPADSYTVEVVHRAHPPAQRQLTTEGLGATRIETIVLGESATLVGVVRRGELPAVGVGIMLDQASSLFYRGGLGTDGEGRFRAERVAVGKHEVFFTAGSTSVRRLVTLHEGEQTVEFELPGGTKIAGRLLLPDGGPAAQWNVAARRSDEMAGDSRMVTSADGRFSWEDLPRASYSLVAMGPEGGGHTFYDVPTSGDARDYRLPPSALWQPASIRGRVENPPAGATLWMADSNGDHATGQGLAAGDGIELGSLAPGRHRLWLEHDNVVLWLTEVELSSGEVRDLGTVQLPRCGALVVTLRGTDEVDAKGAYVGLRSASTRGGGGFGPRPQVSADGTWQCERVPTGTWWGVVGGKGVAPEVREVYVENDSTQRIEFELVPAVAVAFHFSAGSADASAVGWRRQTVRRVSDGAIVLFREMMGPLRSSLDLAPGSYTIEVETAGGFHGFATFDAPASVPVEVSLARR